MAPHVRVRARKKTVVGDKAKGVGDDSSAHAGVLCMTVQEFMEKHPTISLSQIVDLQYFRQLLPQLDLREATILRRRLFKQIQTELGLKDEEFRAHLSKADYADLIEAKGVDMGDIFMLAHDRKSPEGAEEPEPSLQHIWNQIRSALSRIGTRALPLLPRFLSTGKVAPAGSAPAGSIVTQPSMRRQMILDKTNAFPGGK